MTSKDWKTYKIGDFVTIKHGYAFKGEHIIPEDNGIVLVTPGNFAIGGGFQELKCKYYNGEYPQEYILKHNDLIVTMTDLSKDGDTLGYCAKIPDNKNKIYLHNQRIGLLEFKSDKIIKDFLYWYMRTKHYQRTVVSSCSGSVIKHTSPSRICEIEIPIPPLEPQEKIARVLSSLDDKIELNNKINQNLEQQAQAIFKSWFVDFEPFGGKMPEDWRIGTLGEYIEIKRGGSPRPIQNFITDKGCKWLKISDVTSLQTPFIYDIKESIKESGLNKTVLLKAGTLVLSNSATPGIPKILGIDSCIHDGWLYFPESKFSNEYLYLLFKSIRKNLVSLGNGSVFTNLKTDILRNYQTVLSSESVLKNFDSIVKPIFSNIQNNTLENINLTQLRDTLLPKLMSGEIDVDKVNI